MVRTHINKGAVWFTKGKGNEFEKGKEEYWEAKPSDVLGCLF